MSSVDASTGWSPSVNRALLWASGCASLRPGTGPIGSEELFLGLLLAHPDENGEVWRFLDHFGLTARDVLPDDYPVIDTAALQKAAAAAHDPSPDEWDAEVAGVMSDAAARAGGKAQVLHVMSVLLMLTPWQDRLQVGLARFGIRAGAVVDQLNNEALRSIDLLGPQTAGAQLGEWLERRFPRRPATMASFTNDVPDPGADFVGVTEEADAFAYLIVSRNLIPPLAIGLFGDWGSGKSFLMAKIRQRVAQLTDMAAGKATAHEIWPKVTPIEFNAWQYVETDLWAALLSRIFDELSPEARSLLTELRARKDETLQRQRRVQSRIDSLKELETKQADEATDAAREAQRVVERAAAVRDAAARGALEAHARSAAAAGVLTAVAGTLGPQVTNAVAEARRIERAATAPAWRQRTFWSTRRIVWVTAALLVSGALVVVLDRVVTSVPAVVAALTTGAALLTPMLRAVAAFAEGQKEAADKATRQLEEQLSAIVKKAREDQATKDAALAKTRDALQAEEEKAGLIAAEQVDLEMMAARLRAGVRYSDFLKGRSTADDYRKRLGVVSTVSDDLRTLSELVAAYNREPEALQPGGPPNRIVLYIDDLDRCPPARVLEVLEAVHLLLAFPLFVVVVAVDTRWLTTALHDALPILQREAEPGVARPTATDYLEKIFQIPFWVERLDEGARLRLLRGLLLPSVQSPVGAPSGQTGTSLRVGEPEDDAAKRMLAVHGPWLDLDARAFTITAAELAFVEALNPLTAGTPRQVKRFVNICKLLLAMSPPLEAGEGLATERTAACFMAALHQSMPTFALELAGTAQEAAGNPTLASILADMADLTNPALSAERARVQVWVAKQQADPPATAFGQATATMLLKRWDTIKRLRFDEQASSGPPSSSGDPVTPSAASAAAAP